MILTINQIKERLKHRYPFLLVDRVLELEEGVRCKALKNLTINESFFQGHFPDQPVMPAVLILEALAQTGGLAFSGLSSEDDNLTMFLGIDGAKFKSPVVPGDQLIMDVRMTKNKSFMYFFDAAAYVRNPDGEEILAAKATLKMGLVPKAKLTT